MADYPLDELLASYRREGDLMALLKEAQARFGGLGPDLLDELANGIGVPVADLYGVVSFYSFLSTRPVGRHTIRLCQCVPCRLASADKVQTALERELHIKPGETTPDGKFTLEMTNCIGACGQAPAMMIDERRFVDLSEENIAAVLAEFD
ncbi:MAG: NADH-quinone oxidoreductase subunit NuoE family protein [Chloroflexota bacterium]